MIYEKFQEQIAEKYIYETDLLTILAQNVENCSEFKDYLIYIDEFSGFTSQEYEIIRKLIKIAKQVTITICTDSIHEVKNPDTDIFYSNQITINKLLQIASEENIKIEEEYLEKTYRFKDLELKYLEENLYNLNTPIYSKETNNLKIFLAKNPYSEIEQVAKQITLPECRRQCKSQTGYCR